jgi:hypothetical protein
VNTGHVVLSAWAGLALAVGVAATALHGAVLPAPSAARVEVSAPLTLVHVVDESCACSRRLMAYLEARGRDPSYAERVLLVHASAERAAALSARGFEVQPADEDRLAQEYGAMAVPSLVIAREDGSVAYSGAHRPRPAMDPVDLDLAARVRRGEAVSALSIQGCAVSEGLARSVDPLGIKYGSWR